MNNPDLNFVCNQGYAQAVHHVHFHLVPAPVFDSSSIFMPKVGAPLPAPSANPSSQATDEIGKDAQTAENTLDEKAKDAASKDTESPANLSATQVNKDIFKMERERREELDDDDAVVIAEQIRSRL
ncbi:hypothetical protein M408DRAFT_25883 [Serendipita vermifera MAFF 305830]|uniref:HIT domain-containing protein n=1 Tax=Serendipita vermifera MAFF 305830 TaxID=933852 RepID=A0A0C3B0M9_SERVB|nr:hypothetical protein M408DRAFT_25883 [Serendipita vermifera MAFF 305830]